MGIFKFYFCNFLFLIISSNSIAKNLRTDSDSIKEHPFLIVNDEMYEEMRERANYSPWKELIVDARVKFAQEYNYSSDDLEDKAIQLRDIISSGTLLWILEPDSQEVYLEKLENSFLKFDDVLKSRKNPPDDWNSNVPVACAAYNMIICLDILYNEIDLIIRDSAENLIYSFLSNQRSSAWKLSYYASMGIWSLYKSQSEEIVKYKRLYREELEQNLTAEGLFNGGSGYSTSRFVKDEREQKYAFMDVLEFTDEDNYYDDPLIQNLYEWIFGNNFNTYGSIYIFGDAKLGTSIKQRLNKSVATYRANRFSDLAASYSSWYVKDTVPSGRLLIYLAIDSVSQPRRPDLNRIYPDGGAWFIHNPDNKNHLSAAIWNCKSFGGHSHKDVNSIHLSAFGEDLVVNSGYSNWGNGALGYSWNYIHDQAKSSNTVLINNSNHKSKKGGGINEGFIVDSLFAYATGISGPALDNGNHRRSLYMLYPTLHTAGYWIINDEIQAYNPSEQVQILYHPRSSSVSVIAKEESYEWDVKRWTESGVNIKLHLATPPESADLIEGVQADKSNSILTRVLKSTYSTNEYGKKSVITLGIPSDKNHSLPPTSRIVGDHYTGAIITHSDTLFDTCIEANPSFFTHTTNSVFKGKFLFERSEDDSSLFLFGKGLVSYKTGIGAKEWGIDSEKELNLYMNSSEGRIISPGTRVQFRYPGIESVLLDGEAADILENGYNRISVKIPFGEFSIKLIGTGVPEIDPTSGPESYEQKLPEIRVYPNPVKEYFLISGFSRDVSIVEVNLYNVHGIKVASLKSENNYTEDIKFPIDNFNLKSGIYLVKIMCRDFNLDTKTVVKRINLL